MSRAARPVPPIARGEVITADYLMQLRASANASARAIAAPRAAVATADIIFTEISRDTTEVTIYDDAATNYATIDRPDRITLVNADGVTMQLVLNT